MSAYRSSLGAERISTSADRAMSAERRPVLWLCFWLLQLQHLQLMIVPVHRAGFI